MKQTIKDFKEAVIQATKETTKGFDTQAQVIRKEGNTAWVHIPGGVDETPVKMTVNANEGDYVQIRVDSGTAWITGNATSPPTDDTRAIKADNTAINAQIIADNAMQSASTAANAAGRAVASANRAEQAASDASRAAGDAQTSADNAQISATNASEYASRALGNLSTVQSVSETLTYITQHGTMTLTSDVALDPTHVYFVQDNNGDYTVNNVKYAIVAEPDADDLSTYYELTIDESLQNYVGTHLALTGEGLWLLPATSGTNKVLIATGAGSTYTIAGTYLIDASGGTVASFRADGATMSANGVQIAHLGYGAGTNSGGGTSNAPFYTLGARTGNVGNYSVAEGWNTNASGYTAHSEGTSSIASGLKSHAENSSTASGAYAHAEGNGSEASGDIAHAENSSTASGAYAHAEGIGSEASGNISHAQNQYTIAASTGQTALGRYNIADNSDTYAVIIGNGRFDEITQQRIRSNALTIDWNGGVDARGDVNIASGKHYKINGTNLAASDVGAVPTTRTVNSKALSSDITLNASDVGAVPTTRTVNSKALSSDITLDAADVSAVALADKYTRSSTGALDWTNQTEGDSKVIAKSALAFWNGAYSGNNSNLSKCSAGTIIGSNNVTTSAEASKIPQITSGSVIELPYILDLHNSTLDYDVRVQTTTTGTKGEGTLNIRCGKLQFKGTDSDYITSQGTSSGWRYRKWYSGKIEAWAYDLSLGSQTPSVWVSPVRYKDVTVTIPSGIFSAVPTITATGTNNQWGVFSATASSATSVSMRFITCASAASTVKVNIYAVQN